MKNIPQYPKYSASEDGKIIFNNETKKELKQRTDKRGYVWVTLLLTDNQYTLKSICVHRLVAYTYLPIPKSEKHIWVNHKNGIKADNSSSNLEWTTISQNIQHSYNVLGRKPSRHRRGKRHSVLTKALMSSKKIGVLHPKFKGWYVIAGQRYASSYEAEKGTGIERTKIVRYCKRGVADYSFCAI